MLKAAHHRLSRLAGRLDLADKGAGDSDKVALLELEKDSNDSFVQAQLQSAKETEAALAEAKKKILEVTADKEKAAAEVQVLSDKLARMQVRLDQAQKGAKSPDDMQKDAIAERNELEDKYHSLLAENQVLWGKAKLLEEQTAEDSALRERLRNAEADAARLRRLADAPLVAELNPVRGFVFFLLRKDAMLLA